MDNVNPNPTPEEVASLRTQIKNEISDLRELDREIDSERAYHKDCLKLGPDYRTGQEDDLGTEDVVT